MRVPNLLKQLAIFFTAFCASAISATAQQPQNQNPDVIRVNTSLVQTDVMVFDKQGKFVDDLKREQFVLKVDGKPREISFFERVQSRQLERRGAACGRARRGVESRVRRCHSIGAARCFSLSTIFTCRKRACITQKNC